ncbi:MAG: hypothetical protein IT383_05660 [Deltaproteobacteria bacterium]|nr:hypothetical protein [Deltaproteobacteria bacterium]
MGIGIAVGVEIVAAKSIDYAGSRVSRLPDSPNEPFFANMARLGLQHGWDGTGKALPWWYGAISAGMTGSTDFIAGQVLGRLIRTQVEAALEKNPGLKGALGGKPPSFEQILAALHGKDIPGMPPVRAHAFKTVVQSLLAEGDGAILKKLLDGAPGVEIKAPVTRHLQKALTDPGQSEFAGFVERNLLSERPLKGGAIGGTIIGHGVAGAATGLLTGHPELGALVTLLDSLTEGLLAHKAISGKYEALTTIKCAMLLKGIRDAEAPPDWRGQLNNRLVGCYSQMGEEVRLFGEDLYHLAKAADVLATEKLPQLNSELAELVGEEIARATPTGQGPVPNGGQPVSRGYATKQIKETLDSKSASLTNVVRAQVKAARDEIEHHASTSIGSALAKDFAAEKAALEAKLEQLKQSAAGSFAEVLKEHPKLAQFLQGASANPEEASRLATMARAVLKRGVALASGMVHVGRVVVDKAVSAARSVGDTKAAQALGHAILHLARIIEQEVHVPVRLALDMARDAGKAAAFTALDKVGSTATRGLLAGERWANKNTEELRELGEAIEAVRDRLGHELILALHLVQKSSSAGAQALVKLMVQAAGGSDAAVISSVELQRELARHAATKDANKGAGGS